MSFNFDANSANNNILLPFDLPTVTPSNDKGVSSTLTVCECAISDAVAAIEALRGAASAFADSYSDVDMEVFQRRTGELQSLLQGFFFQTFTLLDSALSNMEIAKNLAVGAAGLSRQLASEREAQKEAD